MSWPDAGPAHLLRLRPAGLTRPVSPAGLNLGKPPPASPTAAHSRVYSTASARSPRSRPMLSLLDRTATRRELLRVGGLSALGLSLPALLHAARGPADPALDR